MYGTCCTSLVVIGERRVLIGREGKTERCEDLVLGDLVGDFAAALEGNCTNDGVQRGHKNGVDSRALQIVRLRIVSRMYLARLEEG